MCDVIESGKLNRKRVMIQKLRERDEDKQIKDIKSCAQKYLHRK